MRFHVLGSVEVQTDEGQLLTLPRRQERSLLAILLLEPGRVVPIDRLCDLLWEDDPPQQPHQAVRSLVARIRAMLARAGAAEHHVSLVSLQRGYQLKVDPDAVDAHLFRRLFDAAGRTAEPAERDRLLRDALALWRGPALQHAATDRLRRRLCADLDELYLRALEESMAAGLDLGRHEQIMAELTRLEAEHPTRERIVELRMRALHRQGRTGEALQVYEHARTRLSDELGIDPGPALQRLHQTILRDQNPPRGTAPVRPPAQLPADLTTFAGRSVHLDRLDALLSTSTTAVVISAIAGTAGVGKTALAVHWAHRVRDRFPDGQLYVNLHGFDPVTGPTPPAQVVRQFLEALGVPGPRTPLDPEAQLGLYRSLLADKRFLLVLDNARDADQVRPLLPGTPGCLAVVTSRNQLASLVAINGAHHLNVDLPALDEARQLLALRIGAARVAAEPEAVDELIELSGRLPLALAVAAARTATRPELSLASLAAQIRDTRNRLDALTGDDDATDVRAVFACSYHALSPGAARLFRLLGVHPGPDLSAPAAASLAGVTPVEVGPVLAELTGAHLLTEPVPGRYALHDLLASYATELVHTHDSAADRSRGLHRVLDHYLHTAYAAEHPLNPHRDYQEPIAVAPIGSGATPEIVEPERAMAWFTAEHAVLLAAIRQAESAGFDTHTWQLAWSVASYLNVQGHWYDWAATQRTAVDAARRLDDRPGQAASHHLLGRAYTWLRRFEDGYAHLDRALELYGEVGDHISHARTRMDMSILLLPLGRRAEALVHAERALDEYRSRGHDNGQAGALSTIAWCHTQLGNHRQAVSLCERSLALLRELGDRCGESYTWDILGFAHHHLANYAEAITCYTRAIDLFRDLDYVYFEARTFDRLGDALHHTGDLRGAYDAWEQSLAIFTQINLPEAHLVRVKLADR